MNGTRIFATGPPWNTALFASTSRGKLLLVIAIILGSAALAALIAQRTNIVVQSQLGSITRDGIPALITAHEVSQTTTNIRGAAASVATAADPELLASRHKQLLRDLEWSRSVIDRFDAGNSERVAQLDRSVDEVARVSRALAETVAERIGVAVALDDRIGDLAWTQSELPGCLERGVDVREAQRDRPAREGRMV